MATKLATKISRNINTRENMIILSKNFLVFTRNRGFPLFIGLAGIL